MSREAVLEVDLSSGVAGNPEVERLVNPADVVHELLTC